MPLTALQPELFMERDNRPLAAPGEVNRRSMPIEQLARMAVLALLLLACWAVLSPFSSAILFAMVVAISTWPAYRWLLGVLRGRKTIASLLACIGVALLVIVPVTLLIRSLQDGAEWLLTLLSGWDTQAGFQLPGWIQRLPVLGSAIDKWWRGVGGNGGSVLLGQLIDPARRLALASGKAFGSGLAQTALAAVLLFFMYRDGEILSARLIVVADHLGGRYARTLLATAQRTVVGVMLSIVGTALAQAAVATIGFTIAGVPNALLLGALTFVLSMAPIGPPIIWGGASFWLWEQGRWGMAIFMAIYGMLGISSVDNVIKPFLISRSSHLPFALTFMGVIGGALAFGVPGVFVGPVVLALAINLLTLTLFEPAAAEGVATEGR